MAFFLCLVLCFSISLSPIGAQAGSFDKAKAKKNITVTYKKLSDGVVAIYKNKNSYPVKLKGALKFCDADNKAIQVRKEYNQCLGGKESCAIFYPAPYDSHGNVINYNSYKGTFTVAKSKHKSYAKKITVASDIQIISTNFSAINASGKKLKNIHATIIFYDGNGKILGCQGKYLNCYEKNSTDLFTLAHNSNWGTPAKVKIYIDWAY